MSEKLSYIPVKTEAQIEQAAGLAARIWPECFARILTPQQIAYMVDKFQSAPAMTRQINEEGYEYFLVCVDEVPGGYVSIRAGDGKLMLSKLYMLDDHRGKGFARQILQFVEEAGRQRKCVGVWLTVNRFNERAIAVYRKTGYELTREEQQDIGGGFMMDDYIFEKPL